MYESGRSIFALSCYIIDEFKEALYPTMRDIDIAPREVIRILAGGVFQRPRGGWR